MRSLPPLLSPDGTLRLAIGEVTLANGGLWLLAEADAGGPVGFLLGIERLDGKRAAHPMGLKSTGPPTQAFVAALGKAWGVTTRAPPAHLEGWAILEKREQASTALGMTGEELRLERAVFKVKLGEDAVPLVLELDLKTQGMQLVIAPGARVPLLQLMAGRGPAAPVRDMGQSQGKPTGRTPSQQ